MKTKAAGWLGLLVLGVAAALQIGWWINRQVEADACLDAGHVFDWRKGKCDPIAERLPGPTQWYDQMF